MQQRLKAGQQQHEGGHAPLTGQCHEVFGQQRVQGEVQPRALLRRVSGTRAISGQLQHRLLVTQLRAPPVQLAFQFARLHPAPLPPRVVGVLNRQGWQGHGLALGMGGVQLRKLIDQHAHRPTIGHDVVQGQHQHVIVGVELQQADPQQGAMLQVERPGDVVLQQRQRLVEALVVGQIAQVVARKPQPRAAGRERLHRRGHLEGP